MSMEGYGRSLYLQLVSAGNKCWQLTVARLVQLVVDGRVLKWCQHDSNSSWSPIPVISCAENHSPIPKLVLCLTCREDSSWLAAVSPPLNGSRLPEKGNLGTTSVMAQRTTTCTVIFPAEPGPTGPDKR